MKHETLALFVVISVGSPFATHYLSSMRLFWLTSDKVGKGILTSTVRTTSLAMGNQSIQLIALLAQNGLQ
jgi:hypothetical protein